MKDMVEDAGGYSWLFVRQEVHDASARGKHYECTPSLPLSRQQAHLLSLVKTSYTEPNDSCTVTSPRPLRSSKSIYFP
jgi:hypothetical protein